MKKILVQIIFITMLALLVGCQFPGIDTDNKDTITVYFYNEQTNLLEGEKVPYQAKENELSEDRLYAVIKALSNGPQDKGQISKPIDFYIQEVGLKGNRAEINFSHEYNQLNVQEQVIYRASIVYSITELEYIDEVEFFVEGEPLRTNAGTRLGALGRKDILVTVLNPQPPTNKKTITLYFAKEGEDKLYKEERSIDVNNNIPLERYVVEELIKGPTDDQLKSTLPPDTKINDIKTQDGICQVDLSYNLGASQMASSVQESLVIYSIVDSLTELTNIKKVLFLKDGKKQTEFSPGITTSGTFERNEEIIADVQ